MSKGQFRQSRCQQNPEINNNVMKYDMIFIIYSTLYDSVCKNFYKPPYYIIHIPKQLTKIKIAFLSSLYGNQEWEFFN